MRRFALWELGFRPFYLLASAFAALSIALWVLQYSGVLAQPYLSGPAWHAHEMLFGYTLAVIAGFLFTAVRNWTGQPTPRGALLAALALLWLAGRVLVLSPFAWAAAAANVAFPWAVAAAIAVPLLRSGNRRNYFFIALLLLWGLAALGVHLSLHGVIEWPPRLGLQVGLDAVLFIIAVVAGRVIPMFTNNGVPGAGARRIVMLDRIALASVLALLAADVLDLPLLAGTFAAVGAAAHACRLALWHPWRTLRAPLVWILHAAYAWIPIHLALRVLAFAGVVPDTIAVHALTIGVIGGMTMGMMTRTALGHTGRPLEAGGAEVTCYVLVQVAALARVAGGLLPPRWYLASVVLAATCWSLAFALYAASYSSILIGARIDGKPG